VVAGHDPKPFALGGAASQSFWDENVLAKTGYAMLSAEQYRDVLSQRKSPASNNALRKDEVLTIDQSSDTSALVKVRVLINELQYCDYLSLLKIEGQWRVASKVYCTLVG
jgi:hypothetical protein